MVLNLEPCHDPHYHLKEVTHDATAYYLREGEAPGVWRGAGAEALGLAGQVTQQALLDLFHGKNPADGAYLISARGSASRASTRSEERELDVAAAAARLGLSTEGVRARLRSGVLDGHKGPGGAWRVPASAIAAFQITGSPGPAGSRDRTRPTRTISLAEAARRAGVSRSYLARLIGESPPAVTARPDGSPVSFLVGQRDERGHWRVDPAELERFVANRRPPRAVPAYDLALRAPKSVSILHALGHLIPDADSARFGLPVNIPRQVVEAHHAAVEDALGFLERRAAWIRTPHGRVQATGLTAALFDHRSSRAGDPLLHTHAVIANVATGVDGRRAALDGTALYAWAKAAGHVYQARLRAELVHRLGVRFEAPHNGLADLAGIPREVIDHFSERRREILEVMRRLGLGGAEAAQRAALTTRRPKGEVHQTPKQIAERAAGFGIGPAELTALLGHRPARPLDARAREAISAHLAGPEGLTARATRIDLRDVICALATELPAGATGAQLEAWATELLHDPERFVPMLAGTNRTADVIRRADGRTVRAGGVERTYSTPELLAREAALVAAHVDGWGADGQGVGAGVALPEVVEYVLGSHTTLRHEQAEMVRRITTSGVALEVVVGGPGSGKTFALAAAAEAWRLSGFRVVGTALQGGAADVLATEADLDERHTLTGLLLRCRRDGSAWLNAAVVLVDEAGMADTRQLSRLAAHAAEAGAKVVLVGDPDQLPEVGAGGAFRFLVQRLGRRVVALRENHRQTDPGDRERLDLIRRGHADEAIASAQSDGRWHTAASADAVRQTMLAAWAADPGVIGRDKLMIATTVAEVEWLNRAARAVLAADGVLGDQAVTVRLAAPGRTVDRREFRFGDRVRASRNDWARQVFTGMVGTVTSVDPDAFRVGVTFDRDSGLGSEMEVTLDRGFLEESTWRTPGGRVEVIAPGLTHAYATTANGVQGRTSTRAYVLVTEAGLYRQAAFTAASRARLETHYYAVAVPDADEVHRHDHSRHVPEPSPDDPSNLARAMARDGSQTMAIVTDPRASEIGELMAMPTPWLRTERSRLAENLGAGPPPAEGVRLVRAQLAAAYRIDPAELSACASLTAALRACLGIPGATPQRIADLMLARGETGVRELRSAADPMAVLVWAAQRHTLRAPLSETAVRARDNGGLDGSRAAAYSVARQRLQLIDEAIERQRAGRLALAEAHPSAHLVSLLGSVPDNAGGRTAWRRGAAAVVEYRDAAGLFDRSIAGTDAWEMAIGVRPDSGILAGHHDETCAIVVKARAAIVLAGLRRHVPFQAGRPGRPVESLAQRSLAELGVELSGLRSSRDDRAALLRAVEGARHDLQMAEQVRPPDRRTRRRLPSSDLSPDAVSAARTRLTDLEARLERHPRTEPEHEQHVLAAIGVRRRRLAAQVLTEPPPWVTGDVHRRCSDMPPSDHAVERLAALYVEVAQAADGVVLADSAPTVDTLLDAPEVRVVWQAVEFDAMPNGPEPIDLGR